MARKVRRVRQPTTTPTTPPSRSEPSRRGRRATASRGRATTVEDLREEYAYVLRDLRRVFILALLMFSLLIALNLWLG